MRSKSILRGLVIITLILITSLICFTPLAFAKSGTLATNGSTTWDKNNFTKLNLSWAGANGTSFSVVVKTPTSANPTTYKNPTNGIELVKKNDGSIKNNSDKSIQYDLS